MQECRARRGRSLTRPRHLMTTMPPAVFANATRHLRTPSGDDKSRLNSRVFPSWRFSSSTSLTTPHSTRKLLHTARLPSASTPSTADSRSQITRAILISRYWVADLLYACWNPAPIQKLPPNHPPTGVLLVLELKFYTKIFGL